MPNITSYPGYESGSKWTFQSDGSGWSLTYDLFILWKWFRWQRYGENFGGRIITLVTLCLGAFSVWGIGLTGLVTNIPILDRLGPLSLTLKDAILPIWYGIDDTWGYFVIVCEFVGSWKGNFWRFFGIGIIRNDNYYSLTMCETIRCDMNLIFGREWRFFVLLQLKSHFHFH